MDGGLWHCTGGSDQDHPQEKKCKKAKWLSEGALQIVEKWREVKSKGEKERYTHLNAEFQRVVRRDKKAFLSDQCKEIEENNRMGKTRDLFKKIRDIKGTFHAKMGTNKGQKETASNTSKYHMHVFHLVHYMVWILQWYQKSEIYFRCNPFLLLTLPPHCYHKIEVLEISVQEQAMQNFLWW